MSWFINHTPDIDPCTVCFYFDSSLIIFCYSQWNSNHPPKWFVHVLIPRNCKCYLFWKKSSLQLSLSTLKWKDHSDSSRRVLNLMTSILVRDTKGRFDIDIRGGGKVTMEQRLEWGSHNPENTWNHQNLEEARDRMSPKAFRGSVILLTSFFWTFSLQNYERKNFLF